MYTIFRKEDGRVVEIKQCSLEHLKLNVDLEILDFVEEVDYTATHYLNGGFVIQDEPKDEIPIERYLVVIREDRDKKLSSCDWTQVPDSPLPQEKKQEWANYRQALRDFPNTCADPKNPIWPTPPK